LYASSGLTQPTQIRAAPNGGVFVADGPVGEIKVFRGITKDSKPEQTPVFATGLNRPFGIAFYPPGNSPSGYTSATPIHWFAAPIKAAI
jgi:glucose/arabinose dehydrogenase